MDIDYQTMIKIISQIFWPIGRFSGLFLAAPFFSSNYIIGRAKIVYIFSLSWLCSYLVPPELTFQHFNGYYLVYIIQEMAYGIMMGFILQLVFQIFVLCGQIISMQAGLGFAVMMDPTSKSSVPLVSQFYSFMILLMFLSLNGHLIILDTLINSFKIMPIGTLHINDSIVWNIISFSGWMFKEAVLITIPAIVSLLLVSLAFGVVNRVAPQIHIFSLGFPVTLIMAIAIIQISMPSVGEQMVESLEHGFQYITGTLH